MPSRSSSPTPLASPLGEKPPEYVDEKPERVPALKGRFEGKRSLMVIHELPGGGTADLDLRGEGGVSGLGVYNLRFTSDVVSPFILKANQDPNGRSGRSVHYSSIN
jgi:hypothetical protein